MTTEKTTLAGNIDTHKLELDGLNAKVAELTAQLDTEAQEKDRSLAKIAALTAAVAAAKAASDKREEEAQATQAQIDELTKAKTDAEAALAEAQAKLAEVSGNIDTLAAEKTTLAGTIDTHKADLDAANAKVSELTAQLEAANTGRAGIEAQLAELNKQLENEKQDKDKSVGEQVARVAVLTAAVAAAKSAGDQREEEVKASQKQLEDLQTQLASVETLNAQLAAIQDELNSASASRDAALARVAELEAGVSNGDSSLETLQAQLKDAQDQAMSLAAERDTSQAQVKTLEDEIAGLKANASEPAGNAALAGVTTLALASASKDKAVEAAAAAGVEAKIAACPQDLSEVLAIGSVFEQRLYAAGVGTYWELANLTDEQFKEMLQLNDRQLTRMDFSAIRSDAARLAYETESVGRIWGGTTPDDFEPLEGIGTTYEKRLYDAGICTYEALANTPAEELRRLCPPTKIRTPDYELWISQARAQSNQAKG